MRKLDLTGDKYGHLTVLEPAGNVGKRTAWRCRCDCGKEVVVRTGKLRSGDTKSCGRSECIYANGRLDLTGRRYGHLTVLGAAENMNGDTAWLCRCGCGNETVVRTDSLVSGNTRSCGQAGCSCYGNRMDLTGRSYGHLTVLRPAGNMAGHTAWTCRCGCGREVAVKSRDLREGTRTSCGDPECPWSGKKPTDLTGDTFGHLTVLGPDKDARGRAAWLCRCGCDRETIARAVTLRSGHAGSCGHPDCPWSAKGRLRDLAGRRYGGLTVLRQVEDVDGRPACLCRCGCGNETVVPAADLRNGRARSCGCAGKGP